MSSLTVRKRRPRFTVEELKALVSAVEKVKPVLYGPRATVLNSEAREQAWIEICTAVNSVSPVKRGIPEIKKKWSDWSSVVKKKDTQGAHGSVEPEETITISSKFITPTERRLLAILDTKSGAAKSKNDSCFKEEGSSSSQRNKSMTEDSLGFDDNDNLDSISRNPDDDNSSSRRPSSAATSHNFQNPGDEFLDGTPIQNGVSSRGSMQKRIVKHSDVLLALKRKKLRVMEEQVKIDKERLEVERGILQILKEIKSKRDARSELF